MTTEEVFRGDFDVKNYRVDFMKSGSKLKTIELHGAVFGDSILQNSSGLALIPLDSHNGSLFRHGVVKKSGILKHRPFAVEPFNDANTTDDTLLNDLCCHVVADTSSTSFCVKPHKPTRNPTGQESNQLARDFPLGAAILRRVDTNWSAVGVFPSTASTSQPIWLSKENLEANFRTGKYVQVHFKVAEHSFQVPIPNTPLL